ncbi:MAG: Gfo/Idh/MocA family oxidoreductase [Planctomycetes bacterium]|nr:Gfo/Idh/MocA family oxidoreductase [Planctomycetia bacterium]MBI3464007.1 Gfo/Idh/MocA family oxidoreductase [Planctomycetota bacterium]
MTAEPRRTFLKTLASAALAAPFSQRLVGQESRKAKRIRVGQIGVGHPHAGKLSVFRQSPNYEVVGIVEPDAELRERAKSQPAFADLKWMTQDELLAASGLQAVLVETRVRDLLSTAEACVAAGKHVHLDKPAGASLPQYRRLLESAAKQKLLVQMGYMYRYNPAVVLLREFLKNGWLGEVFEIHAVMSKVVAPADRRRLAEYPGGMMFDLGSHLMDLVVGVLGKPAKVTAFAQHASRLDDALLDNMLAVLSYDRATATVKSSAMEVEGFERRHFVVCGTEGTFHIQPLDNPAARVALSQPRGKYNRGYREIEFSKYTRYVDDAADMAKIIRGEKESGFSYEHDLAVQETLLLACKLPIDK